MNAPLNFDPSFPPLLSGHPVLPPMEPFEAAVDAAERGEAEAGDLFWSCDPDQIAYAVVLEPDVARERAQEMLFVAMTAMADAIGAISPPELGITWTWPTVIHANGARVGLAQMALSSGDDEAGAPDWMVIGIRLALKPAEGVEPGKTPDRTTLWDEGAVDIDTATALESLSRHFLTWVHRWEGDGFKPVHEAWLFRCDGYRKTVEVQTDKGSLAGTFAGLDETGNLLLKRDRGAPEIEVLPAADCLEPARAAVPVGDEGKN
jgi:BirA family biotin operon repressor/biotin-[acetyl-CoA-carboxylase] ligase